MYESIDKKDLFSSKSYFISMADLSENISGNIFVLTKRI